MPPAPPAPTQSAIEPRTALTSVSAPGDATSLFVISIPGSYYLTGNIVGVSGKHGITINCIPPGRIMSEQIRRKYSPEFRAKQSAEEIPVGRYGEPEELAALAVFLASPVARYITGAVLPVDGGLRRYAF